MKMLSKLGHPLALALEGFLAGALLFGAVNPTLLHPERQGATAQSDAILDRLTR